MKKAHIDILAPVGSFESLHAAIDGGANAIYFGVEQLNMRTKSTPSITIQDIKKIVSICHANKVNAYLTLNTTVYDHDKNLVKLILEKSKKAGVDAIIACDIAVIMECTKLNLPVHISTQANVTNIETVEFYSRYANLIVLSRELTLKQVENLVREIKRRKIKGPGGALIKIEIFAHGALCMAVSGKCYLSLHSNNSAANRGACIQNCRHTYTVIDKDSGEEYDVNNEYIMSAKDLCTIDFLDKIIETGVSVIKIEGRARSADYVIKTTKCYREAVDSIANSTYTKEKIESWKTELSSVFNRGFWDGYYLGRKIGEWNKTGESKATQKKVYVAKGVKFFSGKKIAEFKMESGNLKKGDAILVIGPTTGVKNSVVEEIVVDGKFTNETVKGESFTITFPHKIRPSDKLYKLIETGYAQDYSLPQ